MICSTTPFHTSYFNFFFKNAILKKNITSDALVGLFYLTKQLSLSTGDILEVKPCDALVLQSLRAHAHCVRSLSHCFQVGAVSHRHQQ